MATAKRKFKTKRKVTMGPMVYRGWKEFDEGDVVIGQLVGTSIDSYKKTSWHIKVDDAQFADKKAAKKLMGQVWGANSTGKLDKALEELEEGAWIQITYQGKSEMKKGPYEGTEAHDMEVLELAEDDGDDQDDDLDHDTDESDDDQDYDL